MPYDDLDDLLVEEAMEIISAHRILQGDYDESNLSNGNSSVRGSVSKPVNSGDTYGQVVDIHSLNPDDPNLTKMSREDWDRQTQNFIQANSNMSAVRRVR